MFTKLKIMKKLLTMSILLLLTIISSAPTLSLIERNTFNDRLWIELNRQRYEKEFTLFVNHLGYKESKNNWKVINSINCIGEFQFTYSTLKHLGYGHITPNKFKTDPSIFPRELQLKVLRELIKVNEMELIECNIYIGKIVNGAVITKAGLLGACHLGGFGSVYLYLTSNGIIDKRDIYGTKISDYVKEFNIYTI
jgi:hypothetical protein